MSDRISRADAIEAVRKCVVESELLADWNKAMESAQELLSALPSADAEPKMTEEVREALMRLTMCAREECAMCKYKDKCGFEFQYNISTENMNTLLDALSAEAVQGEWIHDGQNFKGGLDWCHCSECGQKTSTNGLSVYRFCPNCGARMKGGGE